MQWRKSFQWNQRKLFKKPRNFILLAHNIENLRLLYTFYWPHFPKNKKNWSRIASIFYDRLIALKSIRHHCKQEIFFFSAEYWTILYVLIWTHNGPVSNWVIFSHPYKQESLRPGSLFSDHKIPCFLGKLIFQRVIIVEEMV